MYATKADIEQTTSVEQVVVSYGERSHKRSKQEKPNEKQKRKGKIELTREANKETKRPREKQ